MTFFDMSLFPVMMVGAVVVGFIIAAMLRYGAKKVSVKEQEYAKDGLNGFGAKENPDMAKSEKGMRRTEDWSLSKKMECLERQKLLHKVSNNKIQTIAQNGVVRVYEAHSIISPEGSEATEIYFIFDGRVDILENGRKVAERGEADSVGEIPLLNPAWRRGGTIRASQRVTLLSLPYMHLQNTFDEGRRSSHLLYNMALILAGRLRERGRFQRVPNVQPRIFIGSSTKSLNVAQKVKRELGVDKSLDIVLWTDGVFKPSLTSIESLEKFAETCDFAVIVFGADDNLVLSDGSSREVPRDNVIFELGLFMGILGRNRSFFLVDSAKCPTDLDGVTHEKYTISPGKKSINVKDAVSKIKAVIKERKTRLS